MLLSHSVISSVPKMRGGVLITMPTALQLGFPLLCLKSPPSGIVPDPYRDLGLADRLPTVPVWESELCQAGDRDLLPLCVPSSLFWLCCPRQVARPANPAPQQLAGHPPGSPWTLLVRLTTPATADGSKSPNPGKPALGPSLARPICPWLKSWACPSL